MTTKMEEGDSMTTKMEEGDQHQIDLKLMCTMKQQTSSNLPKNVGALHMAIIGYSSDIS